MNKHAMYMVLCIDRNTMQYYSMLYYALETWEKYYNGDYDVFVSVAAKDFDIWNEEYLGLNITKRFPTVNFYKSDFDRTKYNVYLHKWYDIDKVFLRGYDSIFQFDIDSIFYGDIKYFFEKYNEDHIYSLREGYNEHFFKVLGENGIPSGQLIIPKSAIEKVGNLFEKILIKRDELIKISNEKLDESVAVWFNNLSEQYAAQKVFSDSGVKYWHLDFKDVGMGIEDFEIKCIDGEVKTSLKNKKTVAGYMSANYHLFLPNNYLESQDIKRKKEYCK
jgi:hypothetical protein